MTAKPSIGRVAQRKSAGLTHRPDPQQRRRKDGLRARGYTSGAAPVGQRFGRWVILGVGARKDHSHDFWRARCDCGWEGDRQAYSIVVGLSTQCINCQRRANINARAGVVTVKKDGRRRPEYQIWLGMVARCENPRQSYYHCYGGRGIRVCERWRRSFVAFYGDMGERPSSRHSIDRIDNDGDYEPGNCRWSTWKEQHRNRRGNRLLTIRGRTQCLAAWCEEAGVRSPMVQRRLAKGWSPEDAVFTPPADSRFRSAG